MPRDSLITLFNEFQRYAMDIAVVQRRGYRRESWTYGQLAAIAVKVAQELKKRGTHAGDRVILWAANSAEWMAAFWGCLLRGAVVVPLDDGSTRDFAVGVARGTSAKLIIASASKPDLAPGIPRLKLDDLADLLGPSGVAGTHQRTAKAGITSFGSLADEPLTRNHIAEILFTSGTTAEPRGVVLTHGNFLANLEPLENGIEPYRTYERWFHPLRFVSLVPLSHVFGQFMAMLVPPLLGATVVFEPSTHPAEMVRTIKRERATALIAVPHMLDLLRNHLRRDLEPRGQADWLHRAYDDANGEKFLRRAWRFRRIHRRFGWKFWAFISGGAALAADAEEFFKRLGYAVVQGYGMTETASLISLNHPFRAARGSVGKILPGREFRLAEDGEILVRGENVSAGYWENGGQQTSAEEWLHTGDLGELDAEGNLRFRGRKKSVIITPAGLNVYPEDLESALRKQPGVRDCVVIPRERGGNAEPFAVLLMNNGNEGAAREVVDTANRSLAEYQRMHWWLVWPGPDFPRTPTGKPRIAMIASHIGDKAAQARSSDQPSLSDFIENFAPNASQNLDRELNLSSLDRVELMSALENRYHLELNETAFAHAKTVQDVQRLVREPSARRTEYIFPRWTQREAVRWLRLLVYYVLVWPATQILAHPKIVGREHLQGVKGPVLVICNHVTRRADLGFVLFALPPRFRHRLATAIGGETLQTFRMPPRAWFFAKRWAYQRGYWLVTALFNVFPLPRFAGFRESFRYAGESVDRAYSVLVFPEGETTKREAGQMGTFHPGIGLLADNLHIPIIPTRIDGVWQMRSEGRRLARLGEVTLRIGAPVTFPPGTPPQEIARKLEAAVQSL
jgi:long-chain acyl-CoA synthetase